MERLSVLEGTPIDVDPEVAFAIRRRLAALKMELQPKIDFLAGGAASPVVQNLIGSVQITPNLVLDVEPKTRPDQDWAAAVLDLLLGERVSIDAYSHEAEKVPRYALPDVFARIYADQLESAVGREGPLALMVQVRTSKQRLSGRLDVTRWSTGSIDRPHVFPQQETVLTVDNTFTSAMAWVAEALAHRCSDPRVASRLRSASANLRPGLPQHVTVDPGVALREIPPQWRSYGPAWVTACAVISRISPIHRSGVLEGLGLAVEPWPLLETLLRRSLHAAARLGQERGLDVTARGHSLHRLLSPEKQQDEDVPLRRVLRRRSVEPDGSLLHNGEPIATFEAKYSVPPSSDAIRAHVFQAMTTAAALEVPIAVLVYPEASGPVAWESSGFNDRPGRVLAVGLDMFSYRRGRGDRDRGALLLELVEASTPAFVQVP